MFFNFTFVRYSSVMLKKLIFWSENTTAVTADNSCFRKLTSLLKFILDSQSLNTSSSTATKSFYGFSILFWRSVSSASANSLTINRMWRRRSVFEFNSSELYFKSGLSSLTSRELKQIKDCILRKKTCFIKRKITF